MREYLFRGKRADNGEWVEGDLLHFKVKNVPKLDEFAIAKAKDNLFSSIENYKVIPETVGQYTGLTDKNGRKIFEGDIIRSDNGHTSEVVFYGGEFLAYCHCHKKYNTLYNYFFEVIGNIHDNAEILEGEK